MKTKEKHRRKILNVCFILLLLFPCAEIAARILGWKGQHNTDYKVAALPQRWLIGDPTYGIALNPGNYQITLNDSLQFHTTHTEDGTRKLITNDTSKRQVFVLGCSFTYGYGVNGDQTFAQHLANHFKEHRIRNFAVPGHGQVQSILKLKEQISLGNIPESVLVIYSKEHPQRNAMNRSYRSALHIGFKNSNKEVSASMDAARFPYYSTPDSMGLSFVGWNEMYKNWPGRESFACVNAAQTTYEGFQKMEDSDQITAFLFNEISKECKVNKIMLRIINLDDVMFPKKHPEVVKTATYIAVDFDFSNLSLTNYPYDSHPNAKGHSQIARKLISPLEVVLNGK